MRRLLWANLPRMLGVTRNPSGRPVLEKADTSFNTGNPQGFRVSPAFHDPEMGHFAYLRTSRCVWATGEEQGGRQGTVGGRLPQRPVPGQVSGGPDRPGERDATAVARPAQGRRRLLQLLGEGEG